MIERIANERCGTGPAIVQGRVRQGVAVFIEDANGDLVAIEYLCAADAWMARYGGQRSNSGTVARTAGSVARASTNPYAAPAPRAVW